MAAKDVTCLSKEDIDKKEKEVKVVHSWNGSYL